MWCLCDCMASTQMFGQHHGYCFYWQFRCLYESLNAEECKKRKKTKTKTKSKMCKTKRVHKKQARCTFNIRAAGPLLKVVISVFVFEWVRQLLSTARPRTLQKWTTTALKKDKNKTYEEEINKMKWRKKRETETQITTEKGNKRTWMVHTAETRPETHEHK